jgi:hypothetical protein
VPASPQTHTCPTLPEPPAVEPPPRRGVRQHGVGAAARGARMTPRAAQRRSDGSPPTDEADDAVGEDRV